MLMLDHYSRLSNGYGGRTWFIQFNVPPLDVTLCLQKTSWQTNAIMYDFRKSQKPSKYSMTEIVI